MPDAEGVTLEPHSSCVCPTPIKGLGWVGGWVGVSPPPPPPGGGGGTFVGLWVCQNSGWVPELTPPPLGWLSKTLARMASFATMSPVLAMPAHMEDVDIWSAMDTSMHSCPDIWL